VSLPASTIDQLRGEFILKQDDWIDACKEIDRLTQVIEKKKQEIEILELANVTLRRRVESLELEKQERK